MQTDWTNRFVPGVNPAWNLGVGTVAGAGVGAGLGALVGKIPHLAVVGAAAGLAGGVYQSVREKGKRDEQREAARQAQEAIRDEFLGPEARHEQAFGKAVAYTGDSRLVVEFPGTGSLVLADAQGTTLQRPGQDPQPLPGRVVLQEGALAVGSARYDLDTGDVETPEFATRAGLVERLEVPRGGDHETVGFRYRQGAFEHADLVGGKLHPVLPLEIFGDAVRFPEQPARAEAREVVVHDLSGRGVFASARQTQTIQENEVPVGAWLADPAERVRQERVEVRFAGGGRLDSREHPDLHFELTDEALLVSREGQSQRIEPDGTLTLTQEGYRGSRHVRHPDGRLESFSRYYLSAEKPQPPSEKVDWLLSPSLVQGT